MIRRAACPPHASWSWASQHPRCPFHTAPSQFCRMPICSVLPSLGAPQLPHFYSPSHMVSARRACLTPCFIQWLEGQVGSLQIPNSFFIQSYAHRSYYSTSERNTSGAYLQMCPELVFHIEYHRFVPILSLLWTNLFRLNEKQVLLHDDGWFSYC